MKTIKKLGLASFVALALLLNACSSDDGGMELLKKWVAEHH